MNPLTWLNPGRWLLYGAFAVALVLGYFSWADHIGDVREAKVRAEYQKQADTADKARAAIGAAIALTQAAAQARIVTVTETIIKEVPTYVKTTDCPMPGGFRVLADAAANGELPDPARVADAAPVAAATVAASVADNYGTCHENASCLSGLQDWVRAQAMLK